MDKINLLGVEISNITASQLNDEIGRIIDQQIKCNVLNVNINAMNIAYESEWFRNMLNNAAINFCDGDGVRLGAKIQGKHIVEKITYNRWIWELAAYSESKGYTWYLLGSTQENISKAFNVLQDKYPALKIVGYHNGYLMDSDLEQKVIDEINSLRPNILCLGMGMPVQEKFLLRNFDQLDFNVSLTGGAVFDYISGDFKMTPGIFYRLKLEWFYRFLQQPRRLFKRYFVGNFLFVFRVIKEKWYG